MICLLITYVSVAVVALVVHVQEKKNVVVVSSKSLEIISLFS